MDVCATEVLSPPSNISASVKDGNLLVTWEPPVGRIAENPECFQYELALDDQVEYVCLYELLQILIITETIHTTACFIFWCTYSATRNNEEDFNAIKSAKLSCVLSIY